MTPIRPTVTFTWSPVGIPLVYLTGGHNYPYTHQQDNVSRGSDSRYAANITPTNTLITFVATAVVPAGFPIIEYKWNFGDEMIGYGATASHTYVVANPTTQVSLTVTDSLRRTASTSQVLNLRFAKAIGVRPGIRVLT